MGKFPVQFSNFRTRVTIILVLSFIFVSGLSNLLIHEFAIRSQFNQLREKLMVIAQTAALMVDADLLLEVPLNREGVNAAQYKVIAGKLKKIKEVNPPIKFIYTMTKTTEAGIWQFIVDPEPIIKAKRSWPTSYPGDKYDASRFPEMLKGFSGPSADKKLMLDEWGVTLSGYAPISDKNGKSVAILGVDIAAEDVYNTRKEMHRRGIFVLTIGIFTSIVLGLLISRRITDPIKKLVEGTRRIAAEDLQHRVEIKGNDEIKELADSFNSMAMSLSESRMKLHDYFYRVAQSLVRILEAKDIYTQGHSERVSEYAEKIALKMQLPAQKVELLKRVAQLHDIGKLVIYEGILNKQDKLTEEEWKVIREHPVTGEEILKPLLLDEEMLVMVRSHHERYDGRGYPDKISGGNISIFAQIISVADAYDAMTSARAYRPALSKEGAIGELKNNCGTQFNPQVVEAFLSVLQEEGPSPQA
jgi:putative nucleotidyltransferase with HDIG domain